MSVAFRRSQTAATNDSEKLLQEGGPVALRKELPTPALSGSGSTGRRRSRVTLSAFASPRRSSTTLTGRVWLPDMGKLGRTRSGVKSRAGFAPLPFA